MLDKNVTFYWKVELSRRRISEDILEQHMEIIYVKCEDNAFAINSMEQTSAIFARSGDNKNIEKGDIKFNKPFLEQNFYGNS